MTNSVPASSRLFYCGKSGSGKTARMTRDWLSIAPRTLLVDQTGEWDNAPSPNGAPAMYVDGISDTLDAIRASSHRREWWIVATLDNEEIEALCSRLLPAGRVRTGPVAALGGMTLCLDEVDRVIGPGSSMLRDLWRRGRHAGLSVVSATQRPGNVSKEVTAQCDVIAILALHEPADIEYLRRAMGNEKADEALAWANSGPYRVAYYRPALGTLARGEPSGG